VDLHQSSSNTYNLHAQSFINSLLQACLCQQYFSSLFLHIILYYLLSLLWLTNFLLSFLYNSFLYRTHFLRALLRYSHSHSFSCLAFVFLFLLFRMVEEQTMHNFLYLHPNENPTIPLVSPIFNENTKNKIEFILGTTPLPNKKNLTFLHRKDATTWLHLGWSIWFPLLSAKA